MGADLLGVIGNHPDQAKVPTDMCEDSACGEQG